MCGIFGIIGQSHNNLAYIKSLSRHAKRRGQDSSGIMMFQDEYSVQRADFDISKLTKDLRIKNPEIFLGIGRLITNDNQAKQPFLSDDICVFHNGIVVNDNEVFAATECGSSHQTAELCVNFTESHLFDDTNFLIISIIILPKVSLLG